MIASRIGILAAVCAVLVLWTLGPAARLVVTTALLLVAPGFLLVRALPGPATDVPFADFSMWLGVSISMIALLYQWVTTLGLFLSEPTLAALMLACAFGAVMMLWRAPARKRVVARAFAHPSSVPVLLLTGLFLLTLGVRFYQIRELALPAWVDSVHHALLIRVASERGQAPIALSPYLPIEQLPYHWGYHVVAAASMLLTGVSIPQVMLWQGQALNALHVLTCGALAAFLWRRPWAGVVAGLVVGLVSLMPAFYVSWGRYTQLTGLLLLPPLAIAWHGLLRTRAPRFGVIAALLLAGLNLVHFRVLIFALCMLAALTLEWAIAQPKRLLLRGLAAGAITSISAVLLTAPWLWLLYGRRLVPVVEQPQAFFNTGSYGELTRDLLWSGQNRFLIALALGGALWGIHRHLGAARGMIMWVGTLVVAANPQLLAFLLPAVGATLAIWSIERGHFTWLLVAVPLLLWNPWTVRLSTSWLITNDVVVISLFVPLAVLIGGLAIPFSNSSIGRSGLIVLTLALAGWGAWNTRDILRPSTVLATQPDVEALTWIAANTPPDARFLINAAPWLPTADRGVDGGWWLLPLTGRWMSTPPVIFDYGPPEYVQATREQTHIVARFVPGMEPQIADLIARQHIGYIYLKDGSGKLTRDAFSDTSRFAPVYQRNGVTILAVTGQT